MIFSWTKITFSCLCWAWILLTFDKRALHATYYPLGQRCNSHAKWYLYVIISNLGRESGLIATERQKSLISGQIATYVLIFQNMRPIIFRQHFFKVLVQIPYSQANRSPILCNFLKGQHFMPKTAFASKYRYNYLKDRCL